MVNYLAAYNTSSNYFFKKEGFLNYFVVLRLKRRKIKKTNSFRPGKLMIQQDQYMFLKCGKGACSGTYKQKSKGRPKKNNKRGG